MFSNFKDGMMDSFSRGISVGQNAKKKTKEISLNELFMLQRNTSISFKLMEWMNTLFTNKAISLEVNFLQRGDFSQLVGKDGEAVVSQIDEGQVLHFPHSVRQFGENITLQVKFCEVFQDMSKWRGYFSSSVTAWRRSVNICDVRTMACEAASY